VLLTNPCEEYLAGQGVHHSNNNKINPLTIPYDPYVSEIPVASRTYFLSWSQVSLDSQVDLEAPTSATFITKPVSFQGKRDNRRFAYPRKPSRTLSTVSRLNRYLLNPLAKLIRPWRYKRLS
jgi:hypothetical protein